MRVAYRLKADLIPIGGSAAAKPASPCQRTLPSRGRSAGAMVAASTSVTTAVAGAGFGSGRELRSGRSA